MSATRSGVNANRGLTPMPSTLASRRRSSMAAVTNSSSCSKSSAALAAAIDGVLEGLDGVVARGLPRRYLLDAHFELHQTQAEIAWLDATIADVMSGALSWTEEPGPAFRLSRTTSPQESS